MIKLQNICFSYPNTNEFYQFTLKCLPQSCTLIKGKSGSGKSTLLALISGFLKPSTGKIFLNKQDKTTAQVFDRPISFLFQNNNTFPQLTVFENVSLAINKGKKLSAIEEEKIKYILNQVGILSQKNKKPEFLSGGQLQRVGIARCLLMHRPILLMDEPFSALDEETELELINLILSLKNKFKLTLIIVAHRTNLLKILSSNTYYIRNGKLNHI